MSMIGFKTIALPSHWGMLKALTVKASTSEVDL